MTAASYTADLPFSLDLGGLFIVRVTAVDPGTGAVVSGVRVSNMTITAANVSGAPDTVAEHGDWTLVPGPQ